jgi:methionyl-tRNA formyltransferase
MALRPSTLKIVFAGNRRIGLTCLNMLLKAGITPVMLFVPDGTHAECTKEMRKLLSGVPCMEGKEFRSKRCMDLLKKLCPDYLLSIHFPLILPQEILEIPTVGALNLHPAFLPWNRGWHTPSWAIMDGTPFGATLHWIDAGLDTGPIALQKRVAILPSDTAHELYQNALRAEEEVFRKAIPLLKKHCLLRKQQRGKGTAHKKADLEHMRCIDPKTMSEAEIDRRIRALTTNNPDEAAYFEANGHRHTLRIERTP